MIVERFAHAREQLVEDVAHGRHGRHGRAGARPGPPRSAPCASCRARVSAASSTVTRSPAWASESAAVSPPIPAPTMTTRVPCIDCPLSSARGRARFSRVRWSWSPRTPVSRAQSLREARAFA
jgi:hypothetical protein